MTFKTILGFLFEYFPTLWKNLFFKHFIFISILLAFINFGKNHQPINTVLALFQDSNISQLKLILKQTEQERDGYKQKETALNIEFSKLEKQKEVLAAEKGALYKKTTALEKEIQSLHNIPIVTPSTNKNELAKQFTELGFEAAVKECK